MSFKIHVTDESTEQEYELRKRSTRIRAGPIVRFMSGSKKKSRKSPKFTHLGRGMQGVKARVDYSWVPVFEPEYEVNRRVRRSMRSLAGTLVW